MDARRYLHALRKGWWIIVLVALLGAGGGWYRNESTTPLYAADVTFYVSTPTTTTSNSFSTDQFAQARANTYVRLLSSDLLARRILDRSNIDLSVKALSGKISGSAELNTVLVKTQVLDTVRSRALDIATAVA